MSMPLLALALAALYTVQKPEQPKPPAAEMKLEQYLEKALANSADVALAEARLRLAEAELAKARQAAAAKSTAAFYDLQDAKHGLQVARANLDGLKNAAQKGIVSQSEILKAQSDYEKAQIAVVKLSAVFDGLKADAPANRPAKAAQDDAADPPSKSFIAEDASIAALSANQLRFLKMLDLEVEIDPNLKKVPDDSGELTLVDIPSLFKAVDDQIADAPKWNILYKSGTNAISGRMTLGALLEFVQDSTGHVFALKEYGFMLMPPRDNMVDPGKQDNLYRSIPAVKLWKQAKVAKLKSETVPPPKK